MSIRLYFQILNKLTPCLENIMNLLRRYGRSVFYLMVTDWMILVGTFGIALHLRRYAPGLNIISRSHIAIEALTVFIYAAALIGVFGALHLYKRKTLLSRVSHFLRIFQGVSICVLGYLLLLVLTKSAVWVPSRLVLLNWTFLQFSALIIHRMILFPTLIRAATRAQMQRRVIIIGTSEASIRFAQNLTDQRQHATLRPVGFLSVSGCREKGIKITGELCCLGQISDLPELVNLHKIEGAIITPGLIDLSYQDLMNLIGQCVRLFGWVDVHTDKSAVWHKNLNADACFDIPFVRMREVPNGPMIRAYKETTDVVGALIGIVLLSPLLIATAIAIKLTSPGPVFYTRERIGKKGKTFPFYKFRSMTIGADQDQSRAADIQQYIQNEDSGPQRKIVNTAYITPVGKFIRKWAIDELPQLFNVMKGDMSLIGPRPVPAGEHEISDEWHKRRFDIKPGCTGLWKVYAAKTGVSFNETVLYDIYYARNMNPLLDLYIVLMTIWVILSGRADG
jgi:exopolysaccharide biosynthesis polyprenyl glycosylphosphotransferase